MSTTIAIGTKRKIEEMFVVSEPKGLAIKIILDLLRQFEETEPTFGMNSWSIALELKTTLALVSENESNNKKFDLFYNTETKKLVTM